MQKHYLPDLAEVATWRTSRKTRKYDQTNTLERNGNLTEGMLSQSRPIDTGAHLNSVCLQISGISSTDVSPTFEFRRSCQSAALAPANDFTVRAGHRGVDVIFDQSQLCFLDNSRRCGKFRPIREFYRSTQGHGDFRETEVNAPTPTSWYICMFSDKLAMNRG